MAQHHGEVRPPSREMTVESVNEAVYSFLVAHTNAENARKALELRLTEAECFLDVARSRASSHHSRPLEDSVKDARALVDRFDQNSLQRIQQSQHSQVQACGAIAPSGTAAARLSPASDASGVAFDSARSLQGHDISPELELSSALNSLAFHSINHIPRPSSTNHHEHQPTHTDAALVLQSSNQIRSPADQSVPPRSGAARRDSVSTAELEMVFATSPATRANVDGAQLNAGRLFASRGDPERSRRFL